MRVKTACAILLVASLGPQEALASCDDQKDCGSCVKHEVLFSHACYWCEISETCDSVGSLTSACTPAATNNDCISESDYSSCTKKSASLCSADQPKKARQIHLALAGEGGMRVAWQTRGDKPTDAHVLFATDLAKENGVTMSADRSVQYLSSQGGHGYHHSAKLSGLTPGVTYQYRIVNDGVTSSIRSFKTAAKDLSEANFLVIADMGYGDNGEAVESRQRIEALKASSDLMLHPGDIAYADDAFLHPEVNACATEFCYEQVYDGYMQWMENVTDKIPYMVGPGNHESECHDPACQVSSNIRSSLGNFTAYNARFAMPSQESGGVQNMWYSFDYGPAHIVSANTETDFKGAEEENHGDAPGIFGAPAGHFAPDGAYLKWLEADLKAANSNRAERPWVIVMGHRPWYLRDGDAKNYAKDTGGMEAVKNAHAELFRMYGVDLYITAHEHSYHRLTPLGANKDSQPYPMITTGGAGCDEWQSDKKETGNWDEKGKNELWDYHYYNKEKQIATMKVTKTELTYNAIISKNGVIFDTVKLTKGAESITV